MTAEAPTQQIFLPTSHILLCPPKKQEKREARWGAGENESAVGDRWEEED